MHVTMGVYGHQRTTLGVFPWMLPIYYFFVGTRLLSNLGLTK